MHSNSLPAIILMEALAKAKELNKKAYLVNSVWQDMDKSWATVLGKLDGIWVREILSQKEMGRVHGRMPELSLDLSYWAEVPEGPYTDFFDEPVLGDSFFADDIPDPALCLKDHSWDYVVRSLRTANYYVTGRHHGVYAASRAKVPFVFTRSGTHKTVGLFEWFRTETGIADLVTSKTDDFYHLPREVFQKFFVWLDSKPQWLLL